MPPWSTPSAIRLGTAARLIELGDGDTSFFDALQRDAINERARAIVEAIEEADVLVVGTPVYRASYTGLFKHVFDLIHHDALIGNARWCSPPPAAVRCMAW